MKPIHLTLALLLLAACNNTPKKAEDKLDSQTAVKDTNVVPQAKNDTEVKNWSDDFKNFREAIYFKRSQKTENVF